MSNTIKLPKSVGELSSLAEKTRGNRGGLVGVKVTRGADGKWSVCATNGKVLGRIKGEGQEGPDIDALIPADNVKQAAKSGPIDVTVNPNEVYMKSGDTTTHTVLLSDRYPAVDEVFPKKAPTATVMVNPLLLIEALKVAAKLWAEQRNDAPQVTLNVYGPNDPVLLTSQAEKGAPSFEGLLMPLST